MSNGIQLPETVRCKGDIDVVIDYKDGRQERLYYRNTVLRWPASSRTDVS